MEYIRDLENPKKSVYFKTVTTGPCSLDTFKDLKLKNGSDDEIKFIKHFIGWIRQNNIYIYRIIEYVKYYLVDSETVVQDKYLLCINRVPMRVQERKKLKNFGKKDSEFGYTRSVSQLRVFIIPPDSDEKEVYKKLNKIHDELDNSLEYKTMSEFNKIYIDSSKNKHISKNNSTKLSEISENIALKNSNSKFKIFKPNMKALNMLDRINKRKEGFKSKGYVPPNARKNSKDGTNTIVVKNLPVDDSYLIRDINKQLKDIFSQYGLIDRIKVLSEKRDDAYFKRYCIYRFL